MEEWKLVTSCDFSDQQCCQIPDEPTCKDRSKRWHHSTPHHHHHLQQITFHPSIRRGARLRLVRSGELEKPSCSVAAQIHVRRINAGTRSDGFSVLDVDLGVHTKLLEPRVTGVEVEVKIRSITRTHARKASNPRVTEEGRRGINTAIKCGDSRGKLVRSRFQEELDRLGRESLKFDGRRAVTLISGVRSVP